MNDNAFITSISLRYLLGAYTLLESLQKYGHKEDVHILYYSDIGGENIDKIHRRDYNFNVFTTPLHSYKDYNPYGLTTQTTKGWMCRFLKYIHMDTLKNIYDSWCYISGDALLLNNINFVFDLAKEHIVMSKVANFRGYRVVGEFAKSDNRVPTHDVPFATSDKELFRGIYDNSINDPDFVIRGRGDMRCIYNAIVNQGKVDKLYLLSYEHNVGTARAISPVEKIGNGYYFNDGSRINIAHGPFWSKGHLAHKRYAGLNYELYHEIYLTTGKLYGIDERAFR